MRFEILIFSLWKKRYFTSQILWTATKPQRVCAPKIQFQACLPPACSDRWVRTHKAAYFMDGAKITAPLWNTIRKFRSIPSLAIKADADRTDQYVHCVHLHKLPHWPHKCDTGSGKTVRANRSAMAVRRGTHIYKDSSNSPRHAAANDHRFLFVLLSQMKNLLSIFLIMLFIRSFPSSPCRWLLFEPYHLPCLHSHHHDQHHHRWLQIKWASYVRTNFAYPSQFPSPSGVGSFLTTMEIYKPNQCSRKQLSGGLSFIVGELQ